MTVAMENTLALARAMRGLMADRVSGELIFEPLVGVRIVALAGGAVLVGPRGHERDVTAGLLRTEGTDDVSRPLSGSETER